MEAVAKLFHIIVFLIYSYCIYFTEVYLEIPLRTPNHRYGGRYKYLTHWNLCLQCFMFFLCCLIDFMPTRSPVKRKLLQFKCHFFVSLSLPLCLFVASVFWGLYAIDRELIFPRILDKFYPFWLNHCCHTAIVPFALFDAWIFHHPLPSRKSGIATLLSFIATYLLWILFLGMAKDVWVYPILDVLTWVQKITFFTLCAFILCLYFLASEFVNVLIWGKQPPRVFKVKLDDEISQ